MLWAGAMRHFLILLLLATACGIDDLSDDYDTSSIEQEAAAPPGDDDPPDPKPKSGPINPPPSGLVVKTASDIASVLQFKCGGNSERNDVFRQTEGGQWGIGGSSAPCEDVLGSVWDTSVQPQTNYCYYVKSSNTTHSANTNTVCLKSGLPSTPPTAATLTFVNDWTNRIEVRVRDRSTTERYFRLYRRQVWAGLEWTPVATQLRYKGTGCGTSGSLMKAHRERDCEFTLVDTGLAPDTLYQYKVEAGYFVDGATPNTPLVKSDSETYSVRTKPPLPLGVTSLTISQVSHRDFVVRWENNDPYTDSYKLYARRDDGDYKTKVVNAAINPSATFDGLLASTRYCVSIEGRNAAGTGPRSSERCVTTDEPPPPPMTPPDLFIAEMLHPVFIDPNTSFDVTGRVCNAGTTAAGAFVIGLLIQPYGGSEAVVKTQRFSGLAGSTCANYSMPHSLSVGDYSMRVMADIENSVAEGNESNNLSGWDRLIID